MFEGIQLKQEPIKGNLYLPYLALELTFSRVDLLIEHLPQLDEPIKTELWQSLFYPHAHAQAGDSEDRVDDKSGRKFWYGRCLVEWK